MELKKEKYTFEDFVEIVSRLRAPDGCPWDREQTHKSIRKSVIEEAYELVEAIDGENPEKIADESGDVLLQVVLHAQIGKEFGEYDINDVTDAISRKMIHRHPHVLGDVEVENSEEVLTNWDKIKRQDREQTTVADEMRGVSKYVPTLMRAQKIWKKGFKAGYEYDCGNMDITSEKQLGRLLFDICVSAGKAGIDAEVALSEYLNSYINEFQKYEKGEL